MESKEANPKTVGQQALREEGVSSSLRGGNRAREMSDLRESIERIKYQDKELSEINVKYFKLEQTKMVQLEVQAKLEKEVAYLKGLTEQTKLELKSVKEKSKRIIEEMEKQISEFASALSNCISLGEWCSQLSKEEGDRLVESNKRIASFLENQRYRFKDKKQVASVRKAVQLLGFVRPRMEQFGLPGSMNLSRVEGHAACRELWAQEGEDISIAIGGQQQKAASGLSAKLKQSYTKDATQSCEVSPKASMNKASQDCLGNQRNEEMANMITLLMNQGSIQHETQKKVLELIAPVTGKEPERANIAKTEERGLESTFSDCLGCLEENIKSSRNIDQTERMVALLRRHKETLKLIQSKDESIGALNSAPRVRYGNITEDHHLEHFTEESPMKVLAADQSANYHSEQPTKTQVEPHETKVSKIVNTMPRHNNFSSPNAFVTRIGDLRSSYHQEQDSNISKEHSVHQSENDTHLLKASKTREQKQGHNSFLYKDGDLPSMAYPKNILHLGNFSPKELSKDLTEFTEGNSLLAGLNACLEKICSRELSQFQAAQLTQWLYSALEKIASSEQQRDYEFSFDQQPHSPVEYSRSKGGLKRSLYTAEGKQPMFSSGLNKSTAGYKSQQSKESLQLKPQEQKGSAETLNILLQTVYALLSLGCSQLDLFSHYLLAVNGGDKSVRNRVAVVAEGNMNRVKQYFEWRKRLKAANIELYTASMPTKLKRIVEDEYEAQCWIRSQFTNCKQAPTLK